MTRTDTVIVGTLVLLLAILAALIGVPAIQLAAAPATAIASPGTATPGSRSARIVEGVLGRSRVGQPARPPDAGRPRPRRARSSRASSGNGPDGTLVPDLAERWSVDTTGKTWTSTSGPTRAGTTASRSRAEDVVFTIETLQDPAYTGPCAGLVAARSRSTRRRPRQVRFTLETPLGGFLQALTQPIAPAHLLADVPVEQLADRPVRRPARRVRPVRFDRADRHVRLAGAGRRSCRRPARRAHPRPPCRPTR